MSDFSPLTMTPQRWTKLSSTPASADVGKARDELVAEVLAQSAARETAERDAKEFEDALAVIDQRRDEACARAIAAESARDAALRRLENVRELRIWLAGFVQSLDAALAAPGEQEKPHV